VATVAVAATSMALSGALLASPAFADEEHAFTLDMRDPAPIAPGTDGVITYTLTNTSADATDGFLVRVSLPPDVDVDFGNNSCTKFDTNAEGGDMIDCTFTGGIGKFAPGESKVLEKSYTVAADAAESASLGKVGALVVPIVDGKATEDSTDLDGPNVDYAEITTAAGSASAWDQMKSLFGF
jgi:hypothetical protein